MEREQSYLEGNEVVITGMSGLFPKSDSVLEFMENLYNKVDMVVPVDTGFIHPDAPNFQGKINGLRKFDAQFFKVTFNQAVSMDPMCKKLMEHAYSAIYDAGINPLAMNNMKIGVFVGNCYMDSILRHIYTYNNTNSFIMSGSSKAMLANRISFFLNASGPSFCVEGSTASSLLALDLAHKSICSGTIDGAIVAGCNIFNEPSLSVNIKRSGLLCDDGKTKCFDKNGDGSVRAEAINVIFLQRAKDAKRVYCEVYGTKTKYSYPDIQSPKLRQEDEILKLLDEFYSEAGIDPSDVEYIEASATGIASIDEQELKAIEKFFGDKSKVYIGCLKSNMGDSEGASGICALTKVCLAYHTGQIPATLNCSNAMECSDNVVLLKENTPFGRGFVAINSLSHSGIDCHALLRGYFKPKDPERYKSNIPYLLFGSGRQEACVDQYFDLIQTYALDPEYISLLHNIHSHEIRGHTTRGFMILDEDKSKQPVTLSRSVSHYSGNARQVWFVFSGMGSQWAGMGADLMHINIFSESIKKCDKVLKPKGLDIYKIITEKDKNIFNNILHSFIGIAAIQIGLTDILKAIGIECDYMIGHSVGELGCGYADGCLTAEEMIMMAYSRGAASLQTKVIPGAMAAVGLGYKELCSICPPDIDIACHNSFNSSTISGPVESISKFVKQLNANGIFSKEVPTSNIAYHSRYIAPVGSTLKKHLEDIMNEPKMRSSRWLSTSVKEENWDESYAKYSSPEYYTNNLLNQVYFEETAKHIPSDALVIEIAPHGLLQAILKRSHEACLHIPLTRRGTDNQVKFVLEAIGKIYEAGVSVKIDALYPKIEYPVSTGTPFLSHLVKWEHSEDWPDMMYSGGDFISTRNRNVVLSVSDEDYASIQGHIRNGTIVLPESALLVLTWETLAMSMNMDYRELSVKFTELKFTHQINVNLQKFIHLSIYITKIEGKFEVLYENKIVMSGKIEEIDNGETRAIDNHSTDIKSDITLYEEDIYKLLNYRQHVYKNDFRSLYSLTADCNEARVKWTGDWITFLDGLIQVNILANNHNGISKVHLIEGLTIDVSEHSMEEYQSNINGVTYYNANKMFGIVRSGGVQLVNIAFTNEFPDQTHVNLIETKQFSPHFPKTKIDLNNALYINMQIIADVSLTHDIHIRELYSTQIRLVSDAIKELSTKLPINIHFNSLDNETGTHHNHKSYSTTDVLLAFGVITEIKNTSTFYDKIPNNGFILTLEKRENKKYIKDTNYFNVITSFYINSDFILVLLKKNERNVTTDDWVVVKMENDTSFTNNLFYNLQSVNKRILLLYEGQHYCDFTGYIKSLQEVYGSRINLFMILDACEPKFDIKNYMYSKQLLKNLPFNTLLDGEWGGYYSTSLLDYTVLRNETAYLNEIKKDNDLDPKNAKVIRPNSIIQVKYTGLPLKDDSSENVYGIDFSGLLKRSNRVMGVTTREVNSKEIEPDLDLLWPIPDSWTLEEAATVPLPYVQAYYCLGIRGQLQPEEIVFIDNGVRALSRAMITICLNLNCSLFVSVSDMDEKSYLHKLFPALDEKKIVCSTNNDILATINYLTNNRRCELVINTAAGILREAAMKYVGFMGRFLDMSTQDVLENNKFGFSYLFECRNYNAVNVSSIFKPEYSEDKKILRSMIAEGISKGVVRPLPYVTLSDEELERGLSLSAHRRHRDRIIIKIQDHPITNMNSKLILNAAHTYVVVGDQDELCIALVNLLMNRGAKTIFLNLGSQPLSPLFKVQLITWRSQDVLLKISDRNLVDKIECERLINEVVKSGQLEGIFVLHNNIKFTKKNHSNLQKDDTEEIENIKTVTAINLDKISRDIDSLRYFAILSKNLSTIEDEFSFSVYSKICQYRNHKGLPGLLYRAELVNEVENMTLRKYKKLRPQTIHQMLKGFEKSIQNNCSNAMSFNIGKNIKSDFLKRLTEITGENITTLHDLDKYKLHEIRSLIQEFYVIAIPLEELRQKSLLSIRNIDCELSKFNTKGLNTLISRVDQDRYDGTDSMKLMNTPLNENLGMFYEIEFLDPAADYLLLLPGFEGHYRIFESLCLGLKLRAMTIQLQPELEANSISQMAENIVKNLLVKFDNKKMFYLLGYSFGVIVALEVAVILEKKGLVGIIFCLDTSPETLRTELNTITGNFTNAELQNALISHIYYLVTKETNPKLKDEIKESETFEEKTKAFIQNIRNRVSYSQEYIRLTLETTYKRILLAREYELKHILNSQLVLIKGTTQSDTQFEADYNLSQFSKKPVHLDSVKKQKIINTCEKYFLHNNTYS